MSGNSKNGWNEDNPQPGTLDQLLEQMNNQFTPNPGSFHYQSGFVPAATFPWSSHPQSPYSQPHPNAMPMDPSINPTALGTQVGLNSLRSYSVNQDPFPDMEGNRTPLLRSSSDLGIRLNHFPSHRNDFVDCHYDGILDHHQVESFDGSVFFPQNNNTPLSNVPPYQQHLPTSKASEIIGNQHMHYTSYIPESERPPAKEQSNYFSTKLSNFTASLGTWLSPLDQTRASYNNNNNDIEPEETSGTANRVHEIVADNIQPSTMEATRSPTLTTSTNSSREAKPPIVTKPSYSDVLSKGPLQEGKCFSSPPSSSKSVSFQPTSSNKSRNESSLRTFGTKSNKNRNNTGPGRSNSPNTNISISNNNDLSFNSKHSPLTKVDSSYSKVGLDDFDLPECVSNCNSSYTSNLNNNAKGFSPENNERTKKRSPHSSEEYSPGHQAKKVNKNESRRLSEKLDESPSSSDIERIQCDKLNNYTLFTQQKQTPKRTTYINNNLASFSVGVNTSKTKNTDSSSNNLLHRKSSSAKDETKFQFDVGSIVHGDKTQPSNVSGTGNGNSSPTSPSVGVNTSFSRSTVFGSRGNRNVSTKVERSKEPPSKKNNYKRKKEVSPYSHLDLLMTLWTMCLLWMGILTRAGLWLMSLVVDVVQMSYHLLIHFSLKFWDNLKLYYMDAKVTFKGYWLRITNYISRKKESSKKGRSDRKSPSGLESNIPLPTTGEEAMKRLLACRGKDPYSILGVTRGCTDDDIKKYYKRQAFLVHPDKNKQPGAEEAFKILAHAFEIIGEPERREEYDKKVAEEVHLEGATGELASLLNLLKEKLEEAANTIRCTNCNKRHRRVKLQRPVYAARYCSECQIKHAAREGDIWAESWYVGFWWKHYACMEGAIYDISEWAACQRENLKHLQANTHSVQYRIVSGKKNAGGKNSAPECPTDPELEEFFNNLCRERFGQDFVPGTNQSAGQSSTSDAKKRRGKKKK